MMLTVPYYTEEELDLIVRLHHIRKLSKNLTFQFRNCEYQIMEEGRGYRLRGSTVTTCKSFDGDLTISK